MTPDRVSTRLDEIYRILWEAYGPQHWWPAEDSLEVMIGAVLTQNTNWQNVEKAIANLKRAGLLAAGSLHALAPDELARFIRPAGYFNIKAQRLKNLIALVAETYGGDLQAMEQAATGELRSKLLAVRGIGPETADSILLYAFQRPVFVVDAYTHRILNRHSLIGETASYEEVQELFMDHLPLDAALFNEYHALLVKVGKLHCKRTPLCRGCPLEFFP